MHPGLRAGVQEFVDFLKGYCSAGYLLIHLCHDIVIQVNAFQFSPAVTLFVAMSIHVSLLTYECSSEERIEDCLVRLFTRVRNNYAPLSSLINIII